MRALSWKYVSGILDEEVCFHLLISVINLLHTVNSDAAKHVVLNDKQARLYHGCFQSQWGWYTAQSQWKCKPLQISAAHSQFLLKNQGQASLCCIS